VPLRRPEALMKMPREKSLLLVANARPMEVKKATNLKDKQGAEIRQLKRGLTRVTEESSCRSPTPRVGRSNRKRRSISPSSGISR